MRISRLWAASIAAAVIVLAPATAATAAEPGGNAAPGSETVAENATGEFRADIAEANGYQIVTSPDGTQTSVAVTDEAKRLETEAAAAREAAIASGAVPAPPASNRGEATGNCGYSWVESVKLANDTLAVETGYVVFGAVYEHNWFVNANGFITSATISFGGAPNGGVLNAEGAATVVGPGIAAVPATAFAILNNGQTCYSGIPTSSFG